MQADRSMVLESDWHLISNNRETFLTGFLSLGNQHDPEFKEAAPIAYGYQFVRYMLYKFWSV